MEPLGGPSGIALRFHSEPRGSTTKHVAVRPETAWRFYLQTRFDATRSCVSVPVRSAWRLWSELRGGSTRNCVAVPLGTAWWFYSEPRGGSTVNVNTTEVDAAKKWGNPAVEQKNSRHGESAGVSAAPPPHAVGRGCLWVIRSV